jgi:hypothetical protein
LTGFFAGSYNLAMAIISAAFRRPVARRIRSLSALALSCLVIALAGAGAALGGAAILSSCAGGEGRSVAVKREQLFTIGYGPAEDQVDLFLLDPERAGEKTRVAMREGIFYLANGATSKVVRFSSFGDPLSMIYDPARNPEPVHLRPKPAKPGRPGTVDAVPDQEGLGREAVPYAFDAIGEIAVDSRQTLYVEDRIPPERRVDDKSSGTLLDRVVLRFGKDGRFMDYIGQEGIGGTPFPYIIGLYAASSDELVVVSVAESGWLVHWFDSSGVLQSSLKLGRSDIPLPEKSQDLVPALDRIIPDVSGRNLLIKVDYYLGPAGDSSKSGADLASSWIFRMDVREGKYLDRWPIKPIERGSRGPEGRATRYGRAPGLIGAAGRTFFLAYADDDGKTYVLTYDRSTRVAAKYGIDIASDEVYGDSIYLSPEGVLCALLGSRYEARMVWWRFDKLIAGGGAGIMK